MQAGKCDKSDVCKPGARFFGPFDQCAALPKFKEEPVNVTVDINSTINLKCRSDDEVVRRYVLEER